MPRLGQLESQALDGLGRPVSHSQRAGVKTRGRAVHVQLGRLVQPTVFPLSTGITLYIYININHWQVVGTETVKQNNG